MSALDDIIARDSAPSQPSALDAIIARDSQINPVATAPAPAVVPAQPQAQGSGLAQDLSMGGADPASLTQMGQAARAGWHGISSMANNAANFLERRIAQGVNAIPGVQGSSVGNWLTNTANNDTAVQAAADQQFDQNASPGEKASAIVAPMLIPISGAMAPGNAVRAGIARLPGLTGTAGRIVGNVAGNATNGAVMATGAPIDPNQPVGPQDAQHTAFGAAVGAGLPATFRVLQGVGNTIYNVARPFVNPRAFVGEGLADAVGDNAATMATNIRNAPQYVPGSSPTTAQVANNPAMVQTEKALSNASPDFRTALMNRFIDNNNARWQAINDVARTPAALDQAVQARNDVASPFYDQARGQLYDVDNDFQTLMRRPAMQDALRRGVTIAQNEGNAGVMAGADAIAPTPARTVGTGMMGPDGAELTRTLPGAPGTPATPPSVSGDVLHYMKLGLDDLQASARDNTRLGPSERRAIGDAQNAFMQWMGQASPEYAQGSAAYARMSPPINAMTAGQQLSGDLALAPPNAAGVPNITFPSFKARYAMALRGDPDVSRFGIPQDAQSALNGVQSDLQREMVSSSVRSPGSDTAYNLAANGWLANRLFGQNFEGGGVGKALGTAAQAAGAAGGAAMFGPAGAGVGSAVGSGVGSALSTSRLRQRLNDQLSDLLLNPQSFLPYLDARATGTVNPSQQALARALGRQILPAVVGGVSRSGLVNAP